MAHVTLIRPGMIVSRWAHTTPTCPPIGIAYLASSLEAAGHQVAVIDAVGEAVNRLEPVAGQSQVLFHGLPNDDVLARIPRHTNVIGVSCMFTHEWPVAQDFLRRVHDAVPSARLVAGGEHITAEPAYSLQSCAALEACVLGEGEETLAHLATVLTTGGNLSHVPGIVYREGDQLRTTPPRDRIRQLDDIPPPNWELIPLEQYLDHELGFGVNRGRSMPMLATRGCPYQCTFCSNPTMWTTRWVARRPELVVAEIERYMARYRTTNFDFYDLTAIVKKSWIVEFANLVIERQLQITWQLPSGTRSEAIDDEVAQQLYRSGCRNLSYAPESGSPTVLKRIKKQVNLDHMITSMRSSLRHGLNIKANIIMGFPGETHREIWETIGFMCRTAVVGLQDISVSPYSPYPGSELFRALRAAGKIPVFTDEYFYSLIAYSDLTQTVSYNDKVSSRVLGWYRIVSMALFYAISYGLRPWRFVRTVRNLIARRHESRLEMSLEALFQRLLAPWRPARSRS